MRTYLSETEYAARGLFRLIGDEEERHASLLAGLERSIRDFTASNDKLLGRVFWLNVVLAVFTVVGALATVWPLIK